MSMLKIFDLSVKELGLVALPNGAAQFRRSGVALIWTLLPVFDVYVLNIFSENDRVFWNFGPYRALLSSEIRFHFPSLSRDRVNEIHSVLTRLIKQAGHKKKSDFSTFMLGDWTRTPEFTPYDVPTFLRRLHFRHLSILVPKLDRAYVQSHFEKQVDCFGSDALINCSEKFDLSDLDGLDETIHWKLLNRPIVKTNLDDRAWLYSEIKKYHSEENLSTFVTDLDPRFSIRGLFDLFPVPARFAPFVDENEYAEVLRFRTRVAVIVCPLPQIEKMVFDVRDRGGRTKGSEMGDYPDGLCDEMLVMLESRLSPFRSILDFEFPSVAIAATASTIVIAR